MKETDIIQERYRLTSLLGRGGMAEVWCATDERLERSVAVKVLATHVESEPEFLVRFFAEAQAVAQISHPNVVRVLDFGEHEGRPYLVMEHVPGGSVAELTGAPMLSERAIEIVAGAAAGAGAAHSNGLVHRDIKPANILLDADGTPKLADFGIASGRMSERLTATGQAIGSPHYISPEQAAGRSCTPASDVYSLGVVLYELVTGRRPFESENVTALVIAHVERDPVPPGEIVEDLDPALEALILRCLAKDPEHRFPDGSALTAALEDPALALATSPVAGQEGPWVEVETSWSKRLATVGVAALLLATTAAVTVWGAADPPPIGPQSRDLETRDAGAPDRPRKRERVAVDASPVVETSPSPSPSPTRRADEPEPEPTVAPVPEPVEEPVPEPTPEPTEEPAPEPTPEPTSEPQPTPAPTP